MSFMPRFDDDKKQIWITFFRKIGVEKDYRKLFRQGLDEYISNEIRIESVNGEETHDNKSSSRGYMEDNPPIPEMIPVINRALAENPDRIKLFNTIFSKYNSRPPYSVAESKKLIIKGLGKNLNKYDSTSVPLVYTTLKLPSQANFSGFDTWKEILSADSFGKSDYGNIDFISALLGLLKNELIDIRSFEIIDLDNYKITLKAVIHYKTSPEDPILRENKQIIFGRKSVKLQAEVESEGLTIFIDGSTEYRKRKDDDQKLIRLGSVLTKILAFFFKNPGKPVRTIDIAEESGVEYDNLAGYIWRLRKKLQRETDRTWHIESYPKDCDGYTRWVYKPKTDIINGSSS